MFGYDGERMFGRLAAAGMGAGLFAALLAHSSGGAGREHIHVVRPAETLWSIAAANYAGDPRDAVWRIERRNRLHAALLRPGQRLVLP
jgi:hypothetical protein